MSDNLRVLGVGAAVEERAGEAREADEKGDEKLHAVPKTLETKTNKANSNLRVAIVLLQLHNTFGWVCHDRDLLM